MNNLEISIDWVQIINNYDEKSKAEIEYYNNKPAEPINENILKFEDKSKYINQVNIAFDINWNEIQNICDLKISEALQNNSQSNNRIINIKNSKHINDIKDFHNISILNIQNVTDKVNSITHINNFTTNAIENIKHIYGKVSTTSFLDNLLYVSIQQIENVLNKQKITEYLNNFAKVAINSLDTDNDEIEIIRNLIQARFVFLDTEYSKILEEYIRINELFNKINGKEGNSEYLEFKEKNNGFDEIYREFKNKYREIILQPVSKENLKI
jgi:hypothetical protein